MSPQVPLPPDKATQHHLEPDEAEYESLANNQITWTEEEERRLVRKIDLFLLPTIWLMYLLSYMASRETRPPDLHC
jgi:hypothetical protein